MIISRYLRREVVNTLLAITFILLLAFLSQQVVRYLNYVAVGKIPTSVLLELVSFEVPYLLSFLLPLGLYLGVLLAYGRLHADNEMAIMQMCGFGLRRLLSVTMLMASSVALIVCCLMLWVNPWISAKRQQVMASDEATLHLIQTLMPGRFQVSPDGNHVMYVEEMSRDHTRAQNVFLAQAKKKNDDAEQTSWTLVFSDEGYQVQDKESDDQFFVTTDGYRYEGVPGQNDYKIIQFRKYAVRIPQANKHILHQEDESLSTWELLRDYANPKYAAELQWRLSVALSALVLAMIAIPFSSVRPRQGRYFMLLPAVITYIFYINLLFLARRWVEQGAVPVILGMWWVHISAILLVLMALFYKQRKWNTS